MLKPDVWIPGQVCKNDFLVQFRYQNMGPTDPGGPGCAALHMESGGSIIGIGCDPKLCPVLNRKTPTNAPEFREYLERVENFIKLRKERIPGKLGEREYFLW